jgi:hypothetical protein
MELASGQASTADSRELTVSSGCAAARASSAARAPVPPREAKTLSDVDPRHEMDVRATLVDVGHVAGQESNSAMISTAVAARSVVAATASTTTAALAPCVKIGP